MKKDIEIAQEAKLERIKEIAQKLDVSEDDLIYYGDYKAKVDYRLINKLAHKKDGKIILVTAINPTPAGEGKTTVAIGLSDALQKLGKSSVVCLREPSLGPVFGIKGGAAGGGYAQVVPMEDINLHFTGDLHAIGAANNLLAAILDNHIFHGNSLGIDPRKITWRRAVDMNDRQLRYIVDGLGGKGNGMPREDGFDITVASEIMAVFCLAQNLQDLKDRLARIVVAYTFDGKPVTAGDLKVQGALTMLLKDAFHPNLVQTLEGTPAFIHGGPFANIAHGCNSLIATKLAAKLADYVVTEAGFGADLGAEKFLDIKCRTGQLKPDVVVLVASVRALKHHGGCPKEKWGEENLNYLQKGLANLRRHINNLTKKYNLPVVVAINHFPTDSAKELKMIFSQCADLKVPVAVAEVFAQGGLGGVELAQKVLEIIGREQNRQFSYLYPLEKSISEKIKIIAKEIYHAGNVVFTTGAAKSIAQFAELGYGNLPICMAKTQSSFSDDPKLLGAPEGFEMKVREVRLSAGAGFIVALTGEIMTLPGLPKNPTAELIDVDADEKVVGLF